MAPMDGLKAFVKKIVETLEKLKFRMVGTIAVRFKPSPEELEEAYNLELKTDEEIKSAEKMKLKVYQSGLGGIRTHVTMEISPGRV